LTGDPDMQQNAAVMDMRQSTKISYIHVIDTYKRNVIALTLSLLLLAIRHSIEALISN
jgi:hypothetical protein